MAVTHRLRRASYLELHGTAETATRMLGCHIVSPSVLVVFGSMPNHGWRKPERQVGAMRHLVLGGVRASARAPSLYPPRPVWMNRPQGSVLKPGLKPGRHGGDEFIAVWPDTNHASALEIASRVSELVRGGAARQAAFSASPPPKNYATSDFPSSGDTSCRLRYSTNPIIASNPVPNSGRMPGSGTAWAAV